MTKPARLKACVPMSPIAAAGAGLRRVGRASGLLLAGVLERASVSQSCGYSACTTRISPSSPVLHHLARLPHHRVAGVVVRQREHEAACARPASAERRARRPASSSAACRRSRGCRPRGTPWRPARWTWFGRDDRDRLDAIRRAPPRPGRHLGEAAVAAVRARARAPRPTPWPCRDRTTARRRPARSGRRAGPRSGARRR